MNTVSDAQREVLRQTERHIDTQLTFAAQADQRAVNFCALTIVAATVLVSAAVGNGADKGTTVAILLLLVSATCSAASARPVRLHGPGGKMSQMEPYLNIHYYPELLSALAKRNDNIIAMNDEMIRSSAAYFRLALKFALAGGIVVLMKFIMEIREEAFAI